MFRWLALLAALLLAAPVSFADAWAQENVGAVQESLRKEQEKAHEREEELVQLTEREKALHTDLAKAQARIKSLQANVKKREAALAAIEAKEREADALLAELRERHRQAMADAAAILSGLWRAHTKRSASGSALSGAQLPAWETADRSFEWMRRLTGQAREALRTVNERRERVEEALATTHKLAAEARAGLTAVNKDKDALLKEKLAFDRNLAKVRARKRGIEQELTEILSAISSLNYTLDEAMKAGGVPFDSLKGMLPWPARGTVVARFAPKKVPPVRGVGLKVSPTTADVRAVASGKVVHNDLLRGFGRVVILLHGEEYYTLYAFLADADVGVGQSIEGGAPLGHAGYYPAAEGQGVYFELRFQKKAINPETWLSKP